MKKIFKIFLIIILAFSSMEAKALTLTDTQVKEAIAKKVMQKYKEYTDAQLEVNVVAVPFQDLVLPNGKVTFSVQSNSNKFMARDLEKVSVYVNGKLARKFNVPVEVKVYKEILIASCTIQREKAITSNVVTVERREVSNKMANVLTKDALKNEFVSKKYFVKGEVIDKRFVKAKPDILRNSTVRVFFNTNNLTVSVNGIALSDGVIGESICIMNKNYNKIYKGTVVGENKVLVKI